jgi:hypothetical protein
MTFSRAIAPAFPANPLLRGLVRRGWVIFAALACAAAGIPPHAIVVYHDSWNEWQATGPAATSLAELPAYMNIVNLAFARPDLHYPGDLDLTHTGLEYIYPGSVLRQAIDLLKHRHPDTRVLLSVGGSAYDRWEDMHERAIAALVHDLDADGVDIDYEPHHPGCARDPERGIRCSTDAFWQTLVARLRVVLPRPALLTASVWSVGAYGDGPFRSGRPVSQYTGFMLSLLHSPMALQLDLLSIDAYDAGPQFDPLEAFRAYRMLWPGPLALGVEVSRATGEGPFYSAAGAEALARTIAQDTLGAMMLYPLLAMPDGTDATSPDGRALGTALCRGMGLSGCETPPP